MLINWFTVVAQAINFLILAWLLKRFLFKPILHVIDERAKGIAAQFAEAEAKKTLAQTERDDFQHKNETFDRDRAALLQKAEAEAERRRLLELAHHEADAVRAKRHESLRIEQRGLSQEIGRWVQKEVFAITRKTLADLAAANLEERIVAVFLEHVRSLSGEAKDQMTAALTTSADPARIRSAFDLPPAQRATIENAVKQSFAVETRFEFETAPELIGGIELSKGGRKLAWSIADYLGTLEKSARELMHQDPPQAPKPEDKAKTDSKPDPKLESKPKAGPVREPRSDLAAAGMAPKANP